MTNWDGFFPRLPLLLKEIFGLSYRSGGSTHLLKRSEDGLLNLLKKLSSHRTGRQEIVLPLALQVPVDLVILVAHPNHPLFSGVAITSREASWVIFTIPDSTRTGRCLT